MFRIKICGIRTTDDARLAVKAGADAIGLNFYEQSRRYVEPRAAREIASSVAGHATIVGLFVNASAAEIRAASEIVSLDVIQLHGDEPPELLAELKRFKILRAFRFGPESIHPIAAYLGQCEQLDALPTAVLIDAYSAGEYGGTGKQADWQRLAAERAALHNLPFILAGGLTAENVAEAIRIVQPDGVDVSSGVEISAEPDTPPRKDAHLVQAFVAAANEAP